MTASHDIPEDMSFVVPPDVDGWRVYARVAAIPIGCGAVGPGDIGACFKATGHDGEHRSWEWRQVTWGGDS